MTERASRRKPNVLIICSDQHNPFVTGCYGDKTVKTPSIDGLAWDGVVFDSAYCSSPLCVPSRMSFLTGLYPFRNGAISNGRPLESIIPTYAHTAVAAGYHTVLSGRMHFLGPDQRHGFLERLVGDVAPYARWTRVPEQFSPLKGGLGNMSKPDPLSVSGPGNTFYIDFDRTVTGAACDWLDSYARGGSESPFLMTVGYISPHCPYIAPVEMYDKYAGNVDLEEISGEEFSRLHQSHRDYIGKVEIQSVPLNDRLKAKTAYYGLVDFLDSQIGGILKSLEKNKLDDSTVIFYFSDHGDLIGEHGRWHKGCFFEGSSRVPLIIKFPGKSNAGKRVKEHVSLVDLFPTLADLFNVEVPYGADGRSLLPLISDSASHGDRIVKAEYYERGASRMVRRGKWKLNYYSNYQSRELFDLEKDPEELENLSGIPGFADMERKMLDTVFNDGWDEDVLNRPSLYKALISEYGEKLRERREYFVSTPDFWAESMECKNWVLGEANRAKPAGQGITPRADKKEKSG